MVSSMLLLERQQFPEAAPLFWQSSRGRLELMSRTRGRKRG